MEYLSPENVFKEKSIMESLFEYKNEVAVITIILSFLVLVTLFVIGLIILFIIINFINSILLYQNDKKARYVLFIQIGSATLAIAFVLFFDPMLGVFISGIISGGVLIFDDMLYRTPETYVPALTGQIEDPYKEREEKISKVLEKEVVKKEELPVNIFPNKVIFDRRNFMINDVYIFPIKIEEWPSRLIFGFFNDVFSPIYPVGLSLKLHYIPDDVISTILDMEKRSAETRLQLINQKKFSEIEQLNARISALNGSIEYIVNKNGHFYNIDMAIYTMSKNRMNAYTYATKVQSIMKKGLFKISIPLFNEQKKYFEFFMPYSSKIDPKRFMQSHAVAMHLPLLSEMIYMEGGVFLGINERSFTPIIFNRWSGKFSSSHMIISGTTGYGKSYFVKILTLREYMVLKARGMDVNVFIIDPFGEYRDFAESVGGEVISVKDNPINILSIWNYSSVKDQDEIAEVIRNKVSVVKGFLSMLFSFDKSNEAILDEFLMNIYQNFPNPTFTDLYNMAKGNEKYVRFEKYFYQLSKGSLSIFNTANAVNLNSNVIIFDLTGLDGTVLSYYMFIVLNFIYQNITKNLNPKLVIIDESWRVMEFEYSANFLSMMFRHVRHWNTSMTVITQSMDDFLSTKEGLSIANNSILHVLFKHMNISKQMNDFYGFNEFERGYLMNAPSPTNVGFARALIRFANINQQKIPTRIYATPTENEIATTKPEEVERKRKVRGEL
ncbi:MAG: VirB4 family type IV secretion system protein [Thermoplasmata archaeon]